MASLTLFTIGFLMVPGGVFAGGQAPVTITLIVAGSFLCVLGATLGLAPIRFEEVSVAGLKGRVETRDAEFRDFLRRHRDDLTEFAMLMGAGPREAAELVRDAAAKTRLRWTAGASADPQLATLRTMLQWMEDPAGLRGLLVPTVGGRRTWPWRRREARFDVDARHEAALEVLADVPFADRAALALNLLLGLPIDRIAELLALSEEDVRRRLAATMELVKQRLPSTTELRRAER